MRWHYTVGRSLAAIIKDGYISPAIAHVPKGEKPITWFTTALQWEETANKGLAFPDGTSVTLTRDETEVNCCGLFRIGVADTFPMKRFQRISTASKQAPSTTRALASTAIEAGSNPYHDWWGTLRKVERNNWSLIQFHEPAWISAKDGGEKLDWVTVTEEQAITLIRSFVELQEKQGSKDGYEVLKARAEVNPLPITGNEHVPKIEETLAALEEL